MAVQTTEEFKNGGATSYSITIEYLQASDIKVRIDGALQTYVASSPSSGEYTVSGTTVTLGAQAASGTGNVHIYRETDVNTAAAVFAAGSSIRAADLNAIHESGNPYIIGEMTKLNAAIAQNRDYEIVTDDFNVKSIKLVEDDKPLLSGFSTEPEDTVLPEDLPADNSPANSSAYTDPPADTSSTPAIDAAVAAYKNLPDDPTKPDKMKARRAIQDAVRAAFPGLNPTMVAAKVDALLGIN